MVRSDEDSRDVRDDQPHESNGSGKGDCGSGDECRENQKNSFHLLNVDAQCLRGFFTEQHRIEVFCEEIDQAEAQENWHKSDLHLRPVREPESTHEPEENAVQ